MADTVLWEDRDVRFDITLQLVHFTEINILSNNNFYSNAYRVFIFFQTNATSPRRGKIDYIWSRSACSCFRSINSLTELVRELWQNLLKVFW